MYASDNPLFNGQQILQVIEIEKPNFMIIVIIGLLILGAIIFILDANRLKIYKTLIKKNRRKQARKRGRKGERIK